MPQGFQRLLVMADRLPLVDMRPGSAGNDGAYRRQPTDNQDNRHQHHSTQPRGRLIARQRGSPTVGRPSLADVSRWSDVATQK